MQNEVNVAERLRRYFNRITETIPDGGRHVGLNAHIFKAAVAIPEASEDELLQESYRLNDRLCSPPLSPCEVAVIVKGVMKADKPVKETADRRRQTAVKTAANPKKACTETRTIEYVYRDYDGNEAYRKFRIEKAGKSKTFRREPAGKTHYPFNLTKNDVAGLEIRNYSAVCRRFGRYGSFFVKRYSRIASRIIPVP